MAPCWADPQSIFFSRVIRNYNKLRPVTAAGSNCSGPPGRLAQPPNDFTRDSNIVQQPIVELAQVLAQTPPNKPGPNGVNPAYRRGFAAGLAGNAATGFLNRMEMRHPDSPSLPLGVRATASQIDRAGMALSATHQFSTLA
jgi:hypothetical protein